MVAITRRSSLASLGRNRIMRRNGLEFLGLLAVALAILWWASLLPQNLGQFSLPPSAMQQASSDQQQQNLRQGRDEQELREKIRTISQDIDETKESINRDLTHLKESVQHLLDDMNPPSSTTLMWKQVQEKLVLQESTIPARDQCLRAIRSRQKKILGDIMGNKGQWGEKILLVDPAYHSNVGDHMLTVGELEFAKAFGYDYNNVMQCNYVQSNWHFPDCGDLEQYKNQAKLALWHAGGNWGDLWPAAQDLRIPSFQTLLSQGFTVIGMPQSLHYQDKSREEHERLKIKSCISEGLGLGSSSALDGDGPGREKARSRVILTWREKKSFERAQELYPYVQHRLMPDIAFQLGPYAPIRPEYPEVRDIILLLRGDLESKQLGNRNEYYVKTILDKLPNGKDITFRIVDWDDRLDLFSLSKSHADKEYLFTDSSIKLLSLGRVVISDRLHGAVLSYLSGLPFVYLDQLSNKLTNTLSVAFDSLEVCHDGSASMWSRAGSLEESISTAVSFLDQHSLKTEG